MKIDSNNKWGDYLLIITCISSLIPLFLLSIYNNPAVDDYTYALRDTNRNIIEVVLNTYQNWSGRYFSTAIAQINPLTYHSLTAYKIYPAILIAIFCAAYFYFFKSIFKESLSRLKVLSISAFFILLFVLQAPSVSEAFYWFSGYAAFTVPSILLIFLGALLIKERSLFQQIIAIILAICITGGNEVSAVILFSFLLFINYIFYTNNQRINKRNGLLLIVTFVCIVIVILSPGNFIRAGGETTSHNILWTFAGSILQSLSWFIIWGQALILASIIYIPLFGVKIAKSDNKQATSIFHITYRQYLTFFLLTLLIAHIPPLWGLGTVVIGRIANVIYIFFLFSWFYGLQLIINKNIERIPIHNNRYYKFIYIAIFIAFLLNNVFNINNNIATSYVDLITGKAKNYDIELEKRNIIIQNNKSNRKIITLPLINNLPKTIYFKDISNDENYWANRSYREYWNCKSKIKKEEGAEYNCSNIEALKLFGKDIRKNNFSK
ncbi:DUF6056 family protein [uncultured Bacteroides sp.]|uniref:DUF6056 family protein n=1 Tax=uncultured Bacteroides sp. TaxID=162156 RepID=UPI002AA775EE|nr:DUF6056 family protein [uncultured Bacteroides sp.]